VVVAAALFLMMPGTSAAQAAPADTASRAPAKPINRIGSWSAATASGQTFMGTWTAVLDTAGTVTGTWELEDAERRTVAEGAWSAAKSPDSWTGAWRAVISGRDGEYLGTWTATVGGKPGAPLADLFQNALQAIVSGGWRVGRLSGAWSIRTFK
jgi:hypothetical protein